MVSILTGIRPWSLFVSLLMTSTLSINRLVKRQTYKSIASIGIATFGGHLGSESHELSLEVLSIRSVTIALIEYDIKATLVFQ